MLLNNAFDMVDRFPYKDGDAHKKAIPEDQKNSPENNCTLVFFKVPVEFKKLAHEVYLFHWKPLQPAFGQCTT